MGKERGEGEGGRERGREAESKRERGGGGEGEKQRGEGGKERTEGERREGTPNVFVNRTAVRLLSPHKCVHYVCPVTVLPHAHQSNLRPHRRISKHLLGC